MYAKGCKKGSTTALLKIKRAGKVLYTTTIYDNYIGGWLDLT